MTKLTPCKSCHRHLRSSETSCPFCGMRRVAIGASMIAIATLAIACDGPAAQTPNNNVVIPPATMPDASVPAPPPVADAGPAVPAPTSTTAPTTTNKPQPTPPDQHRMAPMYGMPPMDPNNNR